VDRARLLEFMRSHYWAVQASVARTGAAQAAIVGYAVTDDFQIVFEALDSSRKVQNLRRASRIALVIGGWADGDERTVQYEGTADEPKGKELERLKAVYRLRFPEGWGRRVWPGWVYVRVRPTWVRFSDFTRTPPDIVAFGARDLMTPHEG
jgi:hypothetical protein